MASLLEKYGWHEWLCHTNFSFLVGASHPHEYLRRALAFGYRGLAFGDFDGVYGLARAHLDLRRLCQELAAPIACKLHHAMELHLAPDHQRPVLLRDTLVLLAMNRQGYINLCRLSTLAHRHGKTGAHLPLAELLAHDVEGLAAIQPLRGRRRRTPPGDPEGQAAWRQRHEDLRAHFPGRFYVAISRHLHPAEDLWLQDTLRLARQLDLPCLLSQDAFFHAPEHKDLSDVLQAIRTNQTLDAASAQLFPNAERCLHDLAAIEARFQGLPIYAEALAASRALAEHCCFDLGELRYHYPREMIPAGHTAQSFLESLVWAAAKERYDSRLSPRLSDLLAHELDLIQRLAFADYFLTVWDIVHWARQRGILCQGRGSAANSAVCFVLGITAVDPSLFDLLFERFLSVERGDPPDIDVDFEHERREEVIQYIYARYGRERAAMLANVITFRSKGALRAVGQALGVPPRVLDDVSRHLESRHFRRSGASHVLQQIRLKTEAPAATTGSAETQKIATAAIPWELWGQMAERLKGFPRHLGIHSGGFVITDAPLNDLVAQEPATMPGRSVIQWSKEDVEGLGFFKIDILALGMLTAVRKCFAAIAATNGPQLTLANLPQEDAATYAMIQRADTVGTFQIESRAQMSMLPRLRPRTFYDLVIEVAIIRPGPIQGGMVHPYLRRRSGSEPVSFPDERLRPILARTLGIPLFQEQVMRVAMAVGDFTAGEANELRRHMGAWSLKGDMGPWLGRLAAGMQRQGLSAEFISSLLEQLKGFAHYGFPESHAVSFALLAYASSYLKCHFPAAFFLAVLNSQPMGFYGAHTLLQAARRSGVQILPVCVNHSHWDCTLEDVGSAGRPPRWGLRLGLRLVTALRRVGANTLLSRRAEAGGRFMDFDDSLQRLALHRGDLTALAAADAFAGFGISRRQALWRVESAPLCPTLEDVEEAPCLPPESSLERASQDFAATSATLGPHPARLVREEHWQYPLPPTRLIPAARLVSLAPGQIVHVFGMILVRQAPPAANGMVFFTLEDDTGFLNLVFTPPQYARWYECLERQAFLCVQGRLQRQNEHHSLLVLQVLTPQRPEAEMLALPERPPTAQVLDALPPARNYL